MRGTGQFHVVQIVPRDTYKEFLWQIVVHKDWPNKQSVQVATRTLSTILTPFGNGTALNILLS